MVTLNNPLISVIVPVYNAENSIIRCVESVLAQRAPRVELILVDDGSTDSSPLILESWSDHPQVRVITQCNAGVSSARNAGIAASRGTYLRFVDADDFLPADALSLCLALMNDEVGLIVGESQHFTPQGQPIARAFPPEAQRVLSASDAVNDLLYFHPRHGICDKLFNGELIRAHQLRFNEQIANFEDLLFVMQYLSLLSTQRVICINSVIYHYVESENSATRSSVREKHFSFARSFSEMQRLLSRSNDKFFYFLPIYIRPSPPANLTPPLSTTIFGAIARPLKPISLPASSLTAGVSTSRSFSARRAWFRNCASWRKTWGAKDNHER